jgi:hypothetical protein
MKIVLFFVTIALLNACSSSPNLSNDVHNCRELAYEKNTVQSDASVKYIYDKCILEKEAASKEQNREENVDSFMDFLFDLFWPSKDS